MVLDKIRSFFSRNGSTDDGQVPDTGPSEEELEKLREEKEELEEKLGEMDESEELASRAAALEERQAGIEQEKKEMQKQQKQMQERMQQMQEEQSATTGTVMPPDTESAKGNPVISLDGNVFGEFVEPYIEQGKVGIKVKDPFSRSRYEKVGVAETWHELVVDGHRVGDKDAVLVKLDGDKEPMDIVSVRRHQQIVKKKERLEDEVQSLSQELSELQKQLDSKKKLTNRLMNTLALERMNRQNGHETQKDVALSKMANQRQIEKQRMDNLAEQTTAQTGREQQIIHEYENMHNEEVSKLGKNNLEQSLEDAMDINKKAAQHLQAFFSELDPATREDMMQGMMGGSGGAVNIKEGEN